MPCSISTWAPIACNPRTCNSTGLAPIEQPPGKGTLATPSLAKIGPIEKKAARNLETSSNGGVWQLKPVVSKSITSPSRLIFTPNASMIWHILSTSTRPGIFWSRQPLEQSKDPAMTTSAEFLAPLILTSPESLF
jgi:hypothetical protein